MHRWEIFDPRGGNALAAVPFRWMAVVATRVWSHLDYARPGEGWA